jgi:probable phosphoglycerate mutase
MHLYFIRHGESDANRQHIISNRDLPHPLTERGRAQAAALAARLRTVPVTGIWSSPVPRAAETAAILAAALGVPYRLTPALREYDCGFLEGRSDDEAWRLHRHISQTWLMQGDLAYHPEGGESFFDIRDRFVPFVESLIALPDGPPPGRHILLVAHGGLYALMLPLVLANVDRAYIAQAPFDPTICITAERRAGRLWCVEWGDAMLDQAPGTPSNP